MAKIVKAIVTVVKMVFNKRIFVTFLAFPVYIQLIKTGKM